MSIRKENYKSDLELEVILTLGGVEIPVPDHDFMLVFFTAGKKTYKCRHKGDSWDNCKVVDGRLRCYLDNHGLSAGTLQVEYYDYIPDTDFKDGDQLKVVPRALDIELVYGAGDDATSITAEVATDITEAIVRANAISADLEHKVATDYYRGVGVESIEQTTTSLVDAGENIITCTLTNGEVSTFSVRNGGMNMNNYYTREQVDDSLRGKADLVGGVIPASQLPSFVDDVLEGRLKDGQFYPAIYNPDAPDYFPDVPPYTPERNKVYIETQYKVCYYWDGSAYQALGGGGGGTQVQSDWSEADINAPAYIKHKPALAAVATTGSYNDLTDKPSIPAAQVQSDWSQTDNTKADFIKNKPSIPDAQIQSDWNQTTATAKDYIKNKPTIPAAQVQSNWNESDTSSKAYIQNKPTIPTKTSDLANDSNFVNSAAMTAALSGKQDVTTILPVPSGAIAPTAGYEPNKMYDFGKVASVTFAAYDTSKEIANAVNLYMCTFVVASGGTTLRLNANIKYPNGDDGTELTNLLTTEDRVFEVTIRDNKLSFLYFD